jgi:hypothetical protein
MGFGGGGMGGGFGLGMGGMGGAGAGGEGGMEGDAGGGEKGSGRMGLLDTTIPGVLLFLGIALVGTGLFMFTMVKVWSPRIWLPMAFGVGIALGGQVFKLRSRKIVRSFGSAQICEMCKVELALRECFGCGKWFGPGCQGHVVDSRGELQEDDTHCVECTTCSICGQPTKPYQCFSCGQRICTECLDENKRVCLQCGGKLRIAKGAGEQEVEEGAETSDAKVVVLKSPFGLPGALVKRIADKVKSDMVGQELILGRDYPSLGTEFRLVGSSPGGRVVIRDETRVRIED